MPTDQKAHTAVYGIIIKNNKVLLLRRKNTGFRDGFYSIPAGRIDDLELPTTAMLRELKEEVNLYVKQNQLKFVLSQHRISLGYPCVDFYFLIDDFDELEIKNNEPHKCDELKWADIDNLPNEVLEYIKNAIKAYKNKTSFLEDNSSYLIDSQKTV